MLKVGFIGAGRRAQGGHYPCVNRLGGVTIEAVAELDENRMKQVVETYNIPRTFTDYGTMLNQVDLDVVYIIMGETLVTRPAIDCMNAGKHVFVEKPTGANTNESQDLLNAAVRNNVYCMVGYQRRYTAVTQEAMRRVKENGPATLAVGEFHKLLREGPGATSTLWNDGCHVVDLVRYMVASSVVEVHAYQDSHASTWPNCYNGLIRFANNAVGIVTANRSSGARYLRAELHGLGVAAYMQIPERMEIYEDNSGPEILTGAQICGTDPSDAIRYEGTLEMHSHFAQCIHNGETPCSDIRDVIKTSHLVDQLEGLTHS